MSKSEEIDVEFPVVCETCLGENPYVRMSKQPFGKQCKICARPFTVFRWCPGKNMRFKRTEICVTCCKLKNLCSTCALDLDLKLPVRIRDTALGLSDPISKQNGNREYYVQNAEKEMKVNKGKTDMALYGRLGAPTREVMKSIAETKSFKRILGRTEDDEDADDGIDDSQLITNEAKEIIEDKSITTLLVNGISAETTQQDLMQYFGVWGALKNAVVLADKRCAFVTFEERKPAESAYMSCRGGFQLKEHMCNARFAKRKQKEPTVGQVSRQPVDDGGVSQSEHVKKKIKKINVDAIPLPPGSQKIIYASQKTQKSRQE